MLEEYEDEFKALKRLGDIRVKAKDNPYLKEELENNNEAFETENPVSDSEINEMFEINDEIWVTSPDNINVVKATHALSNRRGKNLKLVITAIIQEHKLDKDRFTTINVIKSCDASSSTVERVLCGRGINCELLKHRFQVDVNGNFMEIFVILVLAIESVYAEVEADINNPEGNPGCYHNELLQERF
ncbi:hypothetical protein C1646_749824 [Rhizophagus diaphanus]|nr:hypothetical protein C1646_749824 [Rhizophagus diaphanus] [Rhizophagus sp. MUCL 43196]